MEIEKAKMMSLDMTQENIKKIAELFPNAITEVVDDAGIIKHAIDFEILKQELSDSLVSDKQERYQMTWPDKKQSILLANKSIVATLRPLPEKSIDFNNTKNVYIEGDNLDALKMLRETYLGKVKMIYIDPPYNTGNDFVYNDDFSQDTETYLDNSGQYDEAGNRMVQNNESSGRFHTNWLNMIYPRIKVSRDLLTDDGVIFISIDDNELQNIYKVCDEIFGERNYIGTFTVENNPKGRKNSKFISVSCEYCVVYARDIDKAYFLESVPKNASDLSEDEDGNLVHNSGKRVLIGENNFNKIVTNFASEKHYVVYYNKDTHEMVLKNEKDFDERDTSLLSSGYTRYYSHRNNQYVENTYTKDKFKDLYEKKLLDFKEDKIYEKNTSTTIRIKSLLVNREYEGVFNGRKVHKIYDFKTTSAGTAFKELFNTDKVIFSAPKNVCLLETLMELVDLNDDFILDFFSGSATTAEAVLRKNNSGLNNHFILVQLPELLNEKDDAYALGYRNLCEIGEDRIRKAGKKITEEAGLLASTLDVGFRVFRLDSSNMNEVYYNPKAMTQNLLEATIDNIKPDRTPLDLLFQVMLECGALLSSKIEEKIINGKKVFVVEDNYIAACFDDEVDDKTVEEIAKLHPIYACFKGSSFNSDSANINAEQIFKTYSPNTEKIKVI